jgi:metal iron transporter
MSTGDWPSRDMCLPSIFLVPVVSIHVGQMTLLCMHVERYSCFSPAIGIIGATVMPHSLFLGSALATQDRTEPPPEKHDDLGLTPTDSRKSDASTLVSPSPLQVLRTRVEETLKSFFQKPSASDRATKATRHSERENNSWAFVRAHIYHGIVDVVVCLLSFAILINSL